VVSASYPWTIFGFSSSDANNIGSSATHQALLKLLDRSMAFLAVVLSFWCFHLPSSRNTSIMFQAPLNKVKYLRTSSHTFSQNHFGLSLPPVPSSYPHSTNSTDISIMPPRAAATSGKDDSTKRMKDLEFLLTCLKTFPNVVQVDYEELSKELVKQGDNINIAAAYANARPVFGRRARLANM
jgi:hypothetical protein